MWTLNAQDPLRALLQWDAETILTTYTTTDNHPTRIRVARKKTVIALDPRTGLPVGTMLPAEEERMRLAAETGDDLDDAEELAGGRGGGGINFGVARPKKEGADERRARKAAAKTAKAERRVEKKGTKELFREEKANQLHIHEKTWQLPSTSLSRW